MAKNEIERFEQAALAEPIVEPDPPNARELKPSDGDFPCPGDRGEQCATASWLTSRKRAGAVAAYLDTIAPDERSADQENDLGCALAWHRKWTEAKDAFAEAERKATSDEQRERARHNLEIANRTGA